MPTPDSTQPTSTHRLTPVWRSRSRPATAPIPVGVSRLAHSGPWPRSDRPVKASGDDAGDTGNAPGTSAGGLWPAGAPGIPACGGASPAAERVEHVHVYDSDGALLASFTSWDAAHAWAHEHTDDPDLRTPMEVEDRANRVARRVRSGRCDFITWEAVTYPSLGCEHAS